MKGCGYVIGAFVLLVVFFIMFPSEPSETENTIIAAEKACEAQTGKDCD